MFRFEYSAKFSPLQPKPGHTRVGIGTVPVIRNTLREDTYSWFGLVIDIVGHIGSVGVA